jgi:hypothetical protein
MGGHIGVAHKHSCQVQTTPQGGSFFDLNTRARGVASPVIWTLVRHARSPADDGSSMVPVLAPAAPPFSRTGGSAAPTFAALTCRSRKSQSLPVVSTRGEPWEHGESLHDSQVPGSKILRADFKKGSLPMTSFSKCSLICICVYEYTRSHINNLKRSETKFILIRRASVFC